MKFTKGKLFRIVAVVAVLTLTVGLFSGCGKDATKDEQGRTIISVGSWPYKEGPNLDNATARKARYEEANPDAVIEPDVWAFERKTFYAKAAGGQLPTLYNVAYTEMPEIINSEYAADISSVLSKRGYEGMFNKNIIDVVSKDGKIYGFPFSSYVLGLAFNADLLKAAGLVEADGTPMQPKDWDEVAEFAVKIKEATGKAGFVFPSSSNMGGWMFSSLAWSYGVDFMEKDSSGKWQATFNTPEAAAALQYIKDLKWKYDVLPATTLIDGTEYYKTFATGNAGMLIAAGDIPKSVVQYGMKPASLGIMAMPRGPKAHVTLLGGSVWCIKADATEEQIDAALRWLEMEYNFNATDELKVNKEKSIQTQLDKNQLVGIKGMSPWSASAPGLAYEHSLIDKMSNANPNNVKLYNEFVANCPAEIRPEEPVCAQELYGIIDSCIQEVLSNKDADCAALLEKANSDFQANYLDNLTY